MPNILILVTGSVAALKLPLLVDKLQHYKASNDGTNSLNIRIVVTESSLHFFSLEQVRAKLLPPENAIYRDVDEWSAWKAIGDPVLHIELRNWADIGIIAPLDANTMGKIASGLCDNFVTCIIRAWDMSKPLYFAPAMNVHMWDHPMTRKSIDVLKELGYIQVGPISKKLACGDIGLGAMAEVDQIATEIINCLEKQNTSAAKP